MNDLKISISRILLASLFLSYSMLSYATPYHSESSALSETQVAIGTYVLYNDIKRPMVLVKNKDNQWQLPYYDMPGPDWDGYLSALSCIGKTCIATGASNVSQYKYSPLFLKSDDEGKTWWENRRIINPPLMTDGSLSAISCTDGMCVAAGWYSNDSTTHGSPMLLVSRDLGNSWSYIQNISHLPEIQSGYLSTITCTKNFCIAGGIATVKGSPDKIPMIITSKDNGQSWTYVQNIKDFPKMDLASLNSIKCNLNSCVAVGSYEDEDRNYHALLLSTQDKGESWSFIKEIPQLANKYFLKIVDLSYINDTFIAVGNYSDKGSIIPKSLILVGMNRGSSWSLSDFSPDTLQMINLISCSDSICLAGGDNISSKDVPLIISQDSGKTWAFVKNIPKLGQIPDNIDAVKCFGDSCTATGPSSISEESHPIMLMTNDRGASWSVQDYIGNFPREIYKVKFSSLDNTKG